MMRHPLPSASITTSPASSLARSASRPGIGACAGWCPGSCRMPRRIRSSGPRTGTRAAAGLRSKAGGLFLPAGLPSVPSVTARRSLQSVTTAPRADDARAVAYEAREVLTLAEVHRRWMATTPLPLHPLVPMVDAWQQLAPEPERIANKSVLIMSRSVAQIKSTSDDYYLSRFQPAIRREPSGQLIMDLTNDEALGPTLPANIWTMGLASAEKRGRYHQRVWK